MKEGPYDRLAEGISFAETVMKPAFRAALGAWSGAAVVVAATFMMRVMSHSAARTAGFIGAIFAGTGMILFSLGHRG